MKNLLLLATVLFFSCTIHATTYVIQVSNYQFSPSSVNASIGDTIKWTWVSGFHTTTSTSVPSGAASWDAPMTSTNTSFSYKLTTAGSYNFVCLYHSVMVGTLNVSAVLPVTLSAFNVTAVNNGASIQWRTVDEQNIAYYIIKRSNNGTNFTDVGQVKAANTTGTHTYNFTDNTIANSDNYVYYFIDVVDKDGVHTASAIHSFKNVLATTTLIRQISPNPANGTDHLMLQFYADKPGNMQVQLYSAGGTLLKQTDMSAVTGINNGHFHTGILAAGTYVLRCTLDDKKETHRIVVQ